MAVGILAGWLGHIARSENIQNKDTKSLPTSRRVAQYETQRHHPFFPFFHPQPFLKLAFLLLLTVHAFEVAYCGARCLALGFTPLNSARWMVSVAANGVFSLSLMPAVRSNKKGD